MVTFLQNITIVIGDRETLPSPRGPRLPERFHGNALPGTVGRYGDPCPGQAGRNDERSG
jgi:hypothetical protein